MNTTWLYKASFKRAFIEAGLPAWLIMSVYMLIFEGRQGYSGILVFFIPVWSALRLKKINKPIEKRFSYYFYFFLAHFVTLFGIIFGVAFYLYFRGLIPWFFSWSSLIFDSVSFFVMAFVPFLIIRGLLRLSYLPFPDLPSKGLNHRLFAIDAVRGWVMIFMALDHAMYFCYLHIFAEGFQGIRPDPIPDAAHYLTRFITHPCAPTFIFLAGVSVALYTLKHREQISESCITEKLITRGIILIVIQLILINWVWGYGFKPGWGLTYFGILACIGSCLIVLGFARRLFVPVLASGSVVLLVVVPLLLNIFPLNSGTDQLFLEILLQPDSSGWLNVYYPVLPWLGVMGVGCACGAWIGATPKRITKHFLIIGVILLVGWLLLRLGGSYGNLVPYQGGDWRDFMLMSKYPPSLVFLMWNLGLMALAIAGHNYFKSKLHFTRFWKVIILFGQTPLFFYMVHLYVYRTLGIIFGVFNSLTLGYVAWVLGLVVMIPLCKGFQYLERKYPDNILQYL
ncbi:MAG: heparan-alpha-glucosaminide N-acetyltransferase domain-containing protein [Candidatus Methanofastidiosia archaeon]|jgi:uncharacterized membrane protein